MSFVEIFHQNEIRSFRAANTAGVPLDMRETAIRICNAAAEGVLTNREDRRYQAITVELGLDIMSSSNAAALARLALWNTKDNSWTTASALLKGGWSP